MYSERLRWISRNCSQLLLKNIVCFRLKSSDMTNIISVVFFTKPPVYAYNLCLQFPDLIFSTQKYSQNRHIRFIAQKFTIFTNLDYILCVKCNEIQFNLEMVAPSLTEGSKRGTSPQSDFPAHINTIYHQTLTDDNEQ